VNGTGYLGYIGEGGEDNIKTELWCENGSRLNRPRLEFSVFSYELRNEDSISKGDGNFSWVPEI
jgi:hypothetical protein